MGRKRGEGKGGKGGKEGRGGDPGVSCIFKFPLVSAMATGSVVYEICRWRYTKFAKNLGPPSGPPKEISRLAIARHGGLPINLFVIPTLPIGSKTTVVTTDQLTIANC